MGLDERTKRTYLNIGYGMIRMKCDPSHPKAIKRETDKGIVYALEYYSIHGRLIDILFRQHDEYGNSWNIVIECEDEEYIVQIHEQSRTVQDFLEKVPNLQQGKYYRFTPYENQKKGKTRAGIWIKEGTEIETREKNGGTRVDSYYRHFEQNDDGTWKMELLHGYPSPAGIEQNDKDEWHIYFMRLTKWLRGLAKAHIASSLFRVNAKSSTLNNENGNDDINVKYNENNPPPPEDDDLPF